MYKRSAKIPRGAKARDEIKGRRSFGIPSLFMWILSPEVMIFSDYFLESLYSLRHIKSPFELYNLHYR